MTMHELPVMDAIPQSAGRMPYALAIAAGTVAYVALRRMGTDLSWFAGVIG